MRKLKKFLLGAAALFLGVTGTAAASFPAYADGAMGAVYRAHIHGRGCPGSVFFLPDLYR